MVGVAVAERLPAEPTAVVVAAPKDVVLGVGVPSTENVYPSKFTFPVPAILYREPTAGTNEPCTVKVNVTTSAETLYAVTAKGDVVLPVDVVIVGGAPGPTCDSASKSVPLYTRGRSVPMDKSEKQMCSRLSIVELCANVPGVMPVNAVYRILGALVTFSSHIIPDESRARV